MKKISKKISYLLRHNPNPLAMDKNGWVDVLELLDYINIDRELLNEIVETNNKKRFIFNDTGNKIRANQGHSIDVDVELEEKCPPDFLYHGTNAISLIEISKQYGGGLKKMNRLYVHLSEEVETAFNVGSRRGIPIVYKIDSKRMNEDGVKFYLSKNGVWLTNYVDLKYMKLI